MIPPKYMYNEFHRCSVRLKSSKFEWNTMEDFDKIQNDYQIRSSTETKGQVLRTFFFCFEQNLYTVLLNLLVFYVPWKYLNIDIFRRKMSARRWDIYNFSVMILARYTTCWYNLITNNIASIWTNKKQVTYNKKKLYISHLKEDWYV